MTTFGRLVFATALAGLGVVALSTGDFAYLLQPVPPWIPARTWLAHASSALLLVCGAGLLWSRTRVRASLVLTAYSLASMLLVHAPRIATRPLEEVRWYGLAEMAIIVAGARLVADPRYARLARLLFGLALLPIGLSHFVYAPLTASLVPSWLPAHFAWAYLTGAGHLAAGLALLFGVVPRLAATMETLMVSTFVLTVHVPGVLRAPGDRDQWTELLVASTVGGAALLLAQACPRRRRREGTP